MAFAKGFESTVSSADFKKYIGVGIVNVLAVNPTAKEMKSKLDREVQAEPNYISTINSNGNDVINARITFYVQTIPELNHGISMSSQITFFVRKEFRKSKEGKLQVIDKYGNTSWVTEEQYKTKAIPVQRNGKPARITSSYRPAYNGEEALISFLKNYLGIYDVFDYVNEEWVIKKDDLSKYEADLNMEKIFKGDFNELKEIISYQPKNKIKVLFGIRTSNDGKEYQTVYPDFTLRSNSNNYTKLAEHVNSRKSAGGLSTTEFEICDLKEYVVTPTDFNNSAAGNDLFGNANSASTNDNPFNAPASTSDDDLPF